MLQEREDDRFVVLVCKPRRTSTLWTNVSFPLLEVEPKRPFPFQASYSNVVIVVLGNGDGSGKNMFVLPTGKMSKTRLSNEWPTSLAKLCHGGNYYLFAQDVEPLQGVGPDRMVQRVARMYRVNSRSIPKALI